MKKTYVFQTLLSVAVLLSMTVAVAQHVPISDPATECPATCDTTAPVPDPLYCMTFPMTGPGSECLTDPLAACPAAWPSDTFAGMPTWPLSIFGEDAGFGWALTAILEDDPFVVTLPAAGTWDFCALSDQVVCQLTPLQSLAAEVAQFSGLLLCADMDINGVLNDCLDLPVTGNGMPDVYELGVLGAVLNEPTHALNAQAVAAMQTNMDAVCALLIQALSNVEITSGNFMDVRALSYQVAPLLISSLGGIISGAAAMGDPLTNAALDDLLGLLEDIGITPPAGGIAGICDSVPALGQAGDASGNGFTNREIYDWFIQVNPAMTVAEYATLALDPATVVPAAVAISGNAGNIDADLTLSADVSDVAAGYSAATYTWYKWELVDPAGLCKNPPTCDQFCELWDWVAIPGETGATLTLSAVQLVDDGAKYAVDVQMDDGTKAVVGTIMASTTLDVTDASAIPVGGTLGLTLLAGACALAGAVGIRRRK